MTSSGRRQLARVGAPAAFLLAATIAVLLVRAALDEGGESNPGRTVATVPTTREEPAERRRQPPARRRQPTTTYVIESGDTYLTIANEFGTTVERLLELNPGVDPNALTVGQRIRVPRR